MSRNFNFKSKTFQPYAKALGEAVLAWNDFHMVLSSLFGTATRIPNKIASDAMWNAPRSDRVQRDMLGALINLNSISYNIPMKMRVEIKWVLSIADEMEELRNNLLHSPIFKEQSGEYFAWHHLGNKRASQLKGKNVLKEARRFYKSVIALREYTEKLNDTLSQSRSPGMTLPERPSLPNRGDSNGRKPRRQASSKGQSPPPQS